VKFPKQTTPHFRYDFFMRTTSWSAKLTEPIPLPKGNPLATLRDAALYITKLPKAEHDAAEWQAAMQALLLVAEHDGPTCSRRSE
jgi:hypothetical protein